MATPGSDAVEVKLFGKWSFEDVEVRRKLGAGGRGLVQQPAWCRSESWPQTPPMQVTDISLEDYIAVKPKFAVYVPHTAGRYQKRRFRKALCPIVERCVIVIDLIPHLLQDLGPWRSSGSCRRRHRSAPSARARARAPLLIAVCLPLRPTHDNAAHPRLPAG